MDLAIIVFPINFLYLTFLIKKGMENQQKRSTKILILNKSCLLCSLMSHGSRKVDRPLTGHGSLKPLLGIAIAPWWVIKFGLESPRLDPAQGLDADDRLNF